jgi:hypothetical protein
MTILESLRRNAARKSELDADKALLMQAVKQIEDMLRTLKVVGSWLSQQPKLNNDDDMWSLFSQVVSTVAKAEGKTP